MLVVQVFFTCNKFKYRTIDLEKWCRLQYLIAYALKGQAKFNSFSGIDLSVSIHIKALEIAFILCICNETNSIGTWFTNPNNSWTHSLAIPFRKNAKFSTTHLDVAQTIRTYVKWGNTNYDLNSVGPILPIPSEKQYKQQKSIQLTTKFLGYILQITTRETDLELNLWMSRALHNFVE